MPPKRKLHLALAREAKRRKSPQTSNDQDGTPGAPPGQSNLDDDHSSHSSSSSSSSSSFTVSEASLFSIFIEDWASSLTRDDLMSLAIVP